jgi:hypothetical protein
MYKHIIISNQIASNFATNEHRNLFLDKKSKKLVNVEGCVN